MPEIPLYTEREDFCRFTLSGELFLFLFFFFFDFNIRSISGAGNAYEYVLFSVTSLTTKSFYCAYGAVVCAMRFVRFTSDQHVSEVFSPAERNVYSRNVYVNIEH